MSDKIHKEVKKSGNSGHVYVLQSWVGDEVTVVRKSNEFTEEDARKCIGNFYELLNNGHDIEESIELMGEYSSLHYDFNAEPFNRLNERIGYTDEKLDKYADQIMELLDVEKQKEQQNEYKIRLYEFLKSYVVTGASIEPTLRDFKQDIRNI